MTNENTSQANDLHEETRRIWDQKAAFWDDRMRDGNDFQRILIAPACERLLNLQAGETVLEIACGNGVFSRRMAQLGVHVIATDFSAQLLERARARSTEYADRIEYHLVDATREEEIVALLQYLQSGSKKEGQSTVSPAASQQGTVYQENPKRSMDSTPDTQRFDAVVCNQAIMDMTEIDPLMRSIRQVLKPGGRFVFSLPHPCFNNTGMTFNFDASTINGEYVMTYSVKITRYLHPSVQKAVGMIGEPAPHYYFDRPLHILFNACFRAGLVLDGLEEPAFNHPDDGSQVNRLLSWANYREIPPVLVARLRVAN